MDLDENGEYGFQYSFRMLNILTTGSLLPDHTLTLKIGFPVMLPRNINPFRRHVNGARYKVKDVHTNLFMWDSFSCDNAEKILDLPKMPYGPGDSNFLIQGSMRTKLPARVCFAIAINKAQGQAFSCALGLSLN